MNGHLGCVMNHESTYLKIIGERSWHFWYACVVLSCFRARTAYLPGIFSPLEFRMWRQYWQRQVHDCTKSYIDTEMCKVKNVRNKYVGSVCVVRDGKKVDAVRRCTEITCTLPKKKKKCSEISILLPSLIRVHSHFTCSEILLGWTHFCQHRNDCHIDVGCPCHHCHRCCSRLMEQKNKKQNYTFWGAISNTSFFHSFTTV